MVLEEIVSKVQYESLVFRQHMTQSSFIDRQGYSAETLNIHTSVIIIPITSFYYKNGSSLSTNSFFWWLMAFVSTGHLNKIQQPLLYIKNLIDISVKKGDSHLKCVMFQIHCLELCFFITSCSITFPDRYAWRHVLLDTLCHIQLSGKRYDKIRALWKVRTNDEKNNICTFSLT